jgi:hypothetical protein
MVEILCRAVIEVLGKPKEHIVKTINSYVEKMEADDKYSIKSKEVAEVKKQEDSDLWVTFGEVEFTVKSVNDLISFCFDYMPSMIEVISPAENELSNYDLSQLLNDMQARLHHVDMVAKQMKNKYDILNSSMRSLLKNYIQILLSKKSLTLKQLSTLTGVRDELLGDFLDILLDEGKVDLNGEVYSLVNNG